MKSPVFVLGCPRSGTTLLSHMLISSGGFAVYRTESHVFDMILPKFGNLRSVKSRERLMDQWLNSHYWRLSGLDREEIRRKVLMECKDGSQFLSTIMNSIAESQNVDRWTEATPAHLLHITQIKGAIPDALVIHVIRDGRDCALSLDKQGWINQLRWHKDQSLLVAGIYWEWMVRAGRRCGSNILPDYLEVRFEDLIERPREVLATVGGFIGQDLDYDRIQRSGVGSVSRPNTSFSEEATGGFSPVGRWKSRYPKERLHFFEAAVGPFLRELGYEMGSPGCAASQKVWAKSLRALYMSYFESKQFIKANTPLSRLMVSTSLMRYGPHYKPR